VVAAAEEGVYCIKYIYVRVYDIIPLLTSAQIGLSLTSLNTSPAPAINRLDGFGYTPVIALCICIYARVLFKSIRRPSS